MNPFHPKFPAPEEHEDRRKEKRVCDRCGGERYFTAMFDGELILMECDRCNATGEILV